MTGIDPSTPSLSQAGHAALNPPTTGIDPFTPSSGHAEQAAAPVSQTGAPSTAPIANSHGESAEFSAALGRFSEMEVTVKVSNSGPTVGAALNDKLTAESGPVANGAPQSGPGKIAYQLVQSSIASKGENPANNTAKATLDLPSSDTKEVVGRTTVEAEAAAGDVKAPLATPNATSSDQFALNSPIPDQAITPRNDTASGDNSIQRSVVTPASSAASNAHANTFDSSTSGQGKSGRQNAPGPGDGSATFVHSIANSPGPDPASSLLTAHTPSVPAIHANTSTPPTPPSSSSAQQATTLSAWQNYDGGAGKIVRSASITESAGGAAMHVELHSGPMGPIEIHTVVRDGSVGAEIHVQGQEAHTLLAAGLPSLERALTDRNLRVENIAVYRDHTGGGMSGGGRQDSPSDSSPSPHHQALPWDNLPQPRSTARGSRAGEESANTAAGLSVHA
jgi:flagellar hook-length control protein FliK